MSTTIAPAGAAPIGAAPTTTPPSTDPTVPAILQPTSGVSGGGPTGDLQGALEALWGAIGALKGAIDALQGASLVGGGPGGQQGCACQQAQAGGGALGAPGPTTPSVEPQAPLSPAPAAAAAAAPEAHSDWKAPAGTKIRYPVEGAHISSHFGEVSSIRNNRPHSGTDLAVGSGTPITAAAGGKVIDVGFEGSGLGNYVVIDHGNGWVTKYGHMLEKPPVTEGQQVDAGTQIGKVGSTGNSTGPHLHFMVVKDGKNLDAEPFLEGTRTFD